jgi:Ca2+-binding RTX toxin-like protein
MRRRSSGQDNDFALGGSGGDFLMGNEGDDWLEGGDGFDTLAGDNSELFFNSTIIGHDVLNGQVTTPTTMAKPVTTSWFSADPAQ